MVAIVNSGRSKVKRAMHLTRSLFFFLARWNVALECQHIPWVENGAADALSRNDFPSFRRMRPEVCWAPTELPEKLLQALVVDQLDGQ